MSLRPSILEPSLLPTFRAVSSAGGDGGSVNWATADLIILPRQAYLDGMVQLISDISQIFLPEMRIEHINPNPAFSAHIGYAALAGTPLQIDLYNNKLDQESVDAVLDFVNNYGSMVPSIIVNISGSAGEDYTQPPTPFNPGPDRGFEIQINCEVHPFNCSASFFAGEGADRIILVEEGMQLDGSYINPAANYNYTAFIGVADSPTADQVAQKIADLYSTAEGVLAEYIGTGAVNIKFPTDPTRNGKTFNPGENLGTDISLIQSSNYFVENPVIQAFRYSVGVFTVNEFVNRYDDSDGYETVTYSP